MADKKQNDKRKQAYKGHRQSPENVPCFCPVVNGNFGHSGNEVFAYEITRKHRDGGSVNDVDIGFRIVVAQRENHAQQEVNQLHGKKKESDTRRLILYCF